jgi:hypothetical protein
MVIDEDPRRPGIIERALARIESERQRGDVPGVDPK